jgi:hypothetical protein
VAFTSLSRRRGAGPGGRSTRPASRRKPEPSAVGKSGPGQAVAEDVTEALTAGRFFRLVDGQGCGLAIGRLYDPSGQNELAPLDDFGRRNLSALNIEFRTEGDWRAA